MDEYDLAIYPGFYRRPMARWNEDGSCAPMARARGPKGEAFQPLLKQSDIDDDIGHIEHEVRGGAHREAPRVIEAASWKLPSPSSQRARRAVGTRNARPGTRVSPRRRPDFRVGFSTGGVSRLTSPHPRRGIDLPFPPRRSASARNPRRRNPRPRNPRKRAPPRRRRRASERVEGQGPDRKVTGHRPAQSRPPAPFKGIGSDV